MRAHLTLSLNSCLLLLFALFSLSSCSKNSNKDSQKLKAAENGGAYYGGIFRINETEYFRSLYPLNIGEVVGHRISNQIYEGLIHLDQKSLQVAPCIAESWEIDSSATVYTFKLRKDVFFHDDACFADGKGRTVNAHDFKYCFDKWCTPAANNKGYEFVKDRIVGVSDYNKSIKNNATSTGGVQGIKALDDYTLQVTLNKPFGSFLYILAMPFGYVFPHEAVKKYGIDMRIKTVGTGPFTLKTLKENEALILLRNKNYWAKDANGNQLPYLNGVRWSFVKDEMAELLAFKQGQLELDYRLPLELADEIVSRDGNLLGDYSDFQYQECSSMDIQYYGFLHTGTMFNNKALRQAFCYAIDREKICDFTLKGAGFPAHYGIVPPSFPSYKNKTLKGYKFDADKARKLLAEAGYPNGEGLAPITLQINSGGGRNEQVAEAIQKMLEENLGISVNITKMPFHQHLENTEAGKLDFWRAGWVADYPDPENFLNLLWGAHVPPKATDNVYLNTFRFVNPDYDKNFEEGLRTINEAQRNATYLKAEQIALDEAAFLPIFYSKERRLLQPYVRNFPQNAMEYRYFGNVYFVPEKK